MKKIKPDLDQKIFKRKSKTPKSQKDNTANNIADNSNSFKSLDSEDYEKIIYNWNKTDKEYPENKTVHELFEEQVLKTPDNIAVVYEDRQLTYQELNQRANQLANYIRTINQINPDDLVALCLDRSEHMLIAILGVLKVDAAYVPMDPSYPDERIAYILGDTQAKIVLTNEVYSDRLMSITKGEDLRNSIIAIDNNEILSKIKQQSHTNLITNIISTNLAYVIYTSGTTGKPKGVMVEHKSVVSLKHCLTGQYQINDRDVILQFSNYVFDASIEQIVLSLLNGCRLILTPKNLWFNKEVFLNYLIINKVTHINATPGILEQFELNNLSSLKRIISGGAVLDSNCYKKISFNNEIQVINEYGPTETTVTSIVNIIKNDIFVIGSPIGNTRCYVLDTSLTALPVGAIGELYIGGV
ncbi:MAG: AMP-binding protein [Neisseriaceae bacterium]